MEYLGKLKEYYDEMLRCNRCGFCQAACPTYEVLRRESATARGRIQLLRAVSEGRLPLSAEISRRLYHCLNCHSCIQQCPGGVHTEEIFALGRRAIAQSDLRAEPPARKLLPVSVLDLRDRLMESHNLLGQPNDNRERWAQAWSNPGQALYFMGCVSALAHDMEEVASAFGQVLSQCGQDFQVLGGEEWCCGYPLLAAGLFEEFEEVRAHNLQIVGEMGVKRIYFNCPSCYLTWSREYETEGLELLHSTELLARWVAEGRLSFEPLDLALTYHDPCDLGRGMGIYDPPREVLRSIPDLTLVEIEDHREEALCCGGGGIYEYTYPDEAGQVSNRLIQALNRTGAEAVITACPKCKRMIQGRAKVMVADILQLTLEMGEFKR